MYGQLKRELDRWHPYVNKYIIMHDTTVGEIYGETIRCGWEPVEQSKLYYIPLEEIIKGIWSAIEAFVDIHKEWINNIKKSLIIYYFNQ